MRHNLFSTSATLNYVVTKDNEIEDEIASLKSGSGSSHYVLVTTEKTLIVDNKIILPSKPEGAFLLNIMIVYDAGNIVTEYDSIFTLIDVANNKYYAKLNEPSAATGFGVVSYLTKVA